MNREEFINVIKEVIESVDHEVWEDSYIYGKKENYEEYLNHFNSFISDARLTNEQLFKKLFN